MFDNLPTSLPFIKEGKIRPLAVTTTTRSEGVPDLPARGRFRAGL
jgi:tripartite-type tricarboxylate transporter receptor subunit TctC